MRAKRTSLRTSEKSRKIYRRDKERTLPLIASDSPTLSSRSHEHETGPGGANGVHKSWIDYILVDARQRSSMPIWSPTANWTRITGYTEPAFDLRRRKPDRQGHAGRVERDGPTTTSSHSLSNKSSAITTRFRHRAAHGHSVRYHHGCRHCYRGVTTTLQAALSTTSFHPHQARLALLPVCR